MYEFLFYIRISKIDNGRSRNPFWPVSDAVQRFDIFRSNFDKGEDLNR